MLLKCYHFFFQCTIYFVTVIQYIACYIIPFVHTKKIFCNRNIEKSNKFNVSNAPLELIWIYVPNMSKIVQFQIIYKQAYICTRYTAFLLHNVRYHCMCRRLHNTHAIAVWITFLLLAYIQLQYNSHIALGGVQWWRTHSV